MATTDFPLEQLAIPLPCPVDWNSMTGDERVRFCGQCRQRVYNLSEMTRQEAEAVLQSLHSPTVSVGSESVGSDKSQARVCVRFYQRPDGTVVTQDCFALRRALRKSVRTMFAMTAGAALVMLGCLGFMRKSDGWSGDRWTKLRELEPFRTLFGGPQYEVMGAIAPPVQQNPVPMGTPQSPVANP
jgi:hypothetical protein